MSCKISCFIYVIVMKGYISYLLDNYATISDTIEIDCKHEIVAERVASELNISQNGTIVKGDFYHIFDQVVPINKYKQYHSVYFDEMRRISICPEKDDSYISAIFDLEGSFKHIKKENSIYPVVEFRKKAVLNDLRNFMRKSYKQYVVIQGRDLLFTLEGIKKHLIVRRELAEIFIDCIADPDNPYMVETLEKYKENSP
jgi:hypothetical protein